MNSIQLQVPSLYNLCKTNIRNIYKENWSELDVLPKIIKDDLLRSFLLCEEDFSCTDYWDNNVIECWRDVKAEMDSEMFVRIMTHPLEVPTFANDENHIILRYIEWRTSDQTIRRLCEACFISIAKPYQEWCGNLWEERNWSFRNVNVHEQETGDRLLYSIWDIHAWCHRCITTSLLDIFDEDECEEETEFHYSRFVNVLRQSWKSNWMQGKYIDDDEYAAVSIDLKY